MQALEPLRPGAPGLLEPWEPELKWMKNYILDVVFYDVRILTHPSSSIEKGQERHLTREGKGNHLQEREQKPPRKFQKRNEKNRNIKFTLLNLNV